MLRRVEFACAALLLAAVVALVGLASVARAAGSPIIWSIEVAQLLFLWLCVLAIDLAFQDERHFGISLVLDNVPAIGRKAIEIEADAPFSSRVVERSKAGPVEGVKDHLMMVPKSRQSPPDFAEWVTVS